MDSSAAAAGTCAAARAGSNGAPDAAAIADGVGTGVSYCSVYRTAIMRCAGYAPADRG